MTEHERFDIEHPDLAEGIRATLAAAPRMSPAARRFMAGEMEPWEAERLGFTQPASDNR